MGRSPASPYLERQPGLDLLLEDVCDRAIEVGEDLHRQLRVDAVVCDQIIERIRERRAEAEEVDLRVSQSVLVRGSINGQGQVHMYLLRRYSS